MWSVPRRNAQYLCHLLVLCPRDPSEAVVASAMQVYAYTSALTVGVLILSTLVLVQCASSAIWSHQAAAMLRSCSRSLPVKAAEAS